MKTKYVLIVAVALTAVLLSACGPASIVANPAPPQRSISVSGSGQAYLTPDVAYIYIGVHSEKPSASEAVAENNANTQKVITALRNFGVDAKDIRTTNFSIYPSQQYGPDGKPLGTTYMVDNTVYVTVRDLDKLGELLDSAVKAGANTVNSIQFDAADKEPALKQARAEAVKKAQQQAQELADAAGLKLGDIMMIGFSESTPYPVFDGKGGGGGAVEAAVPIQPGQLTLTATVNITYEIK